MREELRKLPGVDRLLQERAVQALAEEYGHDLTVEAIRQTLDLARQGIMASQDCPSTDELVEMMRLSLEARSRPTLRPVINATGVIIHTNLGRAPLSAEARAAMELAARGYTNLEYDLEADRRGSRYVHAEELLCRLTGAEAALVVNNNAGAVLLILTALAQGQEVIVSRGHLVEIGGGFRMPAVMRQSGARLVEIGTTNRTYIQDYEEAITEETALLMSVHRSNFRLTGFVHEPTLGQLVELGEKRGLLVMDDLGSGALLDTSAYGLAHEPTLQESVAQGVALVSASGDKLLGGPQAGIVVGREDLIANLKRHPLTRALRVDKTTIAGLQATLLHYLKGEAEEKVPIWRMIAAPIETIEGRAMDWAEKLTEAGIAARVVDGRSTVGGGSLPGETLPTRLLAIQVDSPDELARRLRAGDPPVIGRIEDDLFLLDPRTVLAEEEEVLIEAIRSRAGEL
ncbi:MAG: L-seryl-tRNA(Sec) selenium transferase [Anaerolineales bacterium]|nr:L-seryl-tRNA(Sec) selenium transferase [Anaerolineales bacterium]